MLIQNFWVDFIILKILFFFTYSLLNHILLIILKLLLLLILLSLLFQFLLVIINLISKLILGLLACFWLLGIDLIDHFSDLLDPILRFSVCLVLWFPDIVQPVFKIWKIQAFFWIFWVLLWDVIVFPDFHSGYQRQWLIFVEVLIGFFTIRFWFPIFKVFLRNYFIIKICFFENSAFGFWNLIFFWFAFTAFVVAFVAFFWFLWF